MVQSIMDYKDRLTVYEALEWEPTGNVAIKLSTEEASNTHYLSPDLIKDLVQQVDGTIVECNTAYGGSRASMAMHMLSHDYLKI